MLFNCVISYICIRLIKSVNSTYFVYDIVLGTVENVDINDKPCIFPLCVKPPAPLYLSPLKDAVDRCP